MIDHSRDMTRVVDLARKMGTGAERTQRPIFLDLLPPCNNACPAGENIQAWLAFAQAGRWKEAWQQLILCEISCNQRELDGAVSIHAVERLLGDPALDNSWKVPVTVPPSGGARLGPGGCGVGVDQCPCHAMAMIEEPVA